MNYENQTQAARSLSTVGGGVAGSNVARTMAVRLEAAASMMYAQCCRIESALQRINGTPSTPHAPAAPEKERMTAPLAMSLEGVEQQVERLCNLASGLEQVA